MPALAAALSPAKPKPLITAEINDQSITRLAGNTHPFASPENDRGALPPSKTLQRMLLVLKRSPAQDKALAEAIQAMHQPTSATFHHWLTPQEIGEKYGPAKADIDKVTDWLSTHGFTVTSISKAHSTIEFSGTVQAFSSAFHTEMHSFAHRDGLYSANVSDPAIPSALAPVVAGFASLNNFPRVHLSQQPRAVKYDKQAKKWMIAKPASAIGTSSGAAPLYTTVYNNTTFYPVTPADFATIYNLNPLYKAGIDGTGQTIAIVSESNIHRSDVDQFRSVFGLPPTKLNIIL
ncbi:MAG TPA: protease pro-enzyme activation domain-containing protein, partial [Acidobacteriaceae bacterium]